MITVTRAEPVPLKLRLPAADRCGWEVLPRERHVKTKILLVDDSKFLRLATERALVRAGYDVVTAGDGEAALEMARNESPHIILLDMLLPKMSGLHVLKALKSDPATSAIAVVAFTGMSQKNAERLQHDGAVAYLEKSELGLEQGCGRLLQSLKEIVTNLETTACATK